MAYIYGFIKIGRLIENESITNKTEGVFLD